jgi:hypothetical protein
MPQLSTTIRNGILDLIESTLGTSPILRIYTGDAPAGVGDASTGTLLVEITLPSNWMADASSGSKVLAGSWTDTAEADGTAGYYRLFESTGTTCSLQGTCSGTSGSGEMRLNSTGGGLENGQTVTVVSYTLAAGNA